MNVKEYIEKNRGRFQEELFSLIRIPSISSDPSHKNDMQRVRFALEKFIAGDRCRYGRGDADFSKSGSICF